MVDQLVERILKDFIQGEARYALAKRLVEALELTDTVDLQGKIAEVINRDLSDQESYAVEVLQGIMEDYGMFLDMDPSTIKPHSML